jgi:hypothetical protein
VVFPLLHRISYVGTLSKHGVCINGDKLYILSGAGERENWDKNWSGPKYKSVMQVLGSKQVPKGWCTLGCTTFLVPVHSSCTIHRIRKYISKKWSLNLGQNNLLMIGVNHLSQMANKFHLYFCYTCRKKNFKAKNTARPRVKVYVFGNFLVLHYRFEAGKNILKRIICPSTHTYFF